MRVFFVLILLCLVNISLSTHLQSDTLAFSRSSISIAFTFTKVTFKQIEIFLQNCNTIDDEFCDQESLVHPQSSCYLVDGSPALVISDQQILTKVTPLTDFTCYMQTVFDLSVNANYMLVVDVSDGSYALRYRMRERFRVHSSLIATLALTTDTYQFIDIPIKKPLFLGIYFDENLFSVENDLSDWKLVEVTLPRNLRLKLLSPFLYHFTNGKMAVLGSVVRRQDKLIIQFDQPFFMSFYLQVEFLTYFETTELIVSLPVYNLVSVSSLAAEDLSRYEVSLAQVERSNGTKGETVNLIENSLNLLNMTLTLIHSFSDTSESSSSVQNSGSVSVSSGANITTSGLEYTILFHTHDAIPISYALNCYDSVNIKQSEEVAEVKVRDVIHLGQRYKGMTVTFPTHSNVTLLTTSTSTSTVCEVPQEDEHLLSSPSSPLHPPIRSTPVGERTLRPSLLPNYIYKHSSSDMETDSSDMETDRDRNVVHLYRIHSPQQSNTTLSSSSSSPATSTEPYVPSPSRFLHTTTVRSSISCFIPVQIDQITNSVYLNTDIRASTLIFESPSSSFHSVSSNNGSHSSISFVPFVSKPLVPLHFSFASQSLVRGVFEVGVFTLSTHFRGVLYVEGLQISKNDFIKWPINVDIEVLDSLTSLSATSDVGNVIRFTVTDLPSPDTVSLPSNHTISSHNHLDSESVWSTPALHTLSGKDDLIIYLDLLKATMDKYVDILSENLLLISRTTVSTPVVPLLNAMQFSRREKMRTDTNIKRPLMTEPDGIISIEFFTSPPNDVSSGQFPSQSDPSLVLAVNDMLNVKLDFSFVNLHHYNILIQFAPSFYPFDFEHAGIAVDKHVGNHFDKDNSFVVRRSVQKLSIPNPNYTPESSVDPYLLFSLITTTTYILLICENCPDIPLSISPVISIPVRSASPYVSPSFPITLAFLHGDDFEDPYAYYLTYSQNVDSEDKRYLSQPYTVGNGVNKASIQLRNAEGSLALMYLINPDKVNLTSDVFSISLSEHLQLDLNTIIENVDVYRDERVMCRVSTSLNTGQKEDSDKEGLYSCQWLTPVSRDPLFLPLIVVSHDNPTPLTVHASVYTKIRSPYSKQTSVEERDILTIVAESSFTISSDVFVPLVPSTFSGSMTTLTTHRTLITLPLLFVVKGSVSRFYLRNKLDLDSSLTHNQLSESGLYMASSCTDSNGRTVARVKTINKVVEMTWLEDISETDSNSHSSKRTPLTSRQVTCITDVGYFGVNLESDSQLMFVHFSHNHLPLSTFIWKLNRNFSVELSASKGPLTTHSFSLSFNEGYNPFLDHPISQLSQRNPLDSLTDEDHEDHSDSSRTLTHLQDNPVRLVLAIAPSSSSQAVDVQCGETAGNIILDVEAKHVVYVGPLPLFPHSCSFSITHSSYDSEYVSMSISKHSDSLSLPSPTHSLRHHSDVISDSVVVDVGISVGVVSFAVLIDPVTYYYPHKLADSKADPESILPVTSSLTISVPILHLHRFNSLSLLLSLPIQLTTSLSSAISCKNGVTNQHTAIPVSHPSLVIKNDVNGYTHATEIAFQLSPISVYSDVVCTFNFKPDLSLMPDVKQNNQPVVVVYLMARSVVTSSSSNITSSYFLEDSQTLIDNLSFSDVTEITPKIDISYLFSNRISTLFNGFYFSITQYPVLFGDLVFDFEGDVMFAAQTLRRGPFILEISENRVILKMLQGLPPIYYQTTSFERLLDTHPMVISKVDKPVTIRISSESYSYSSVSSLPVVPDPYHRVVFRNDQDNSLTIEVIHNYPKFGGGVRDDGAGGVFVIEDVGYLDSKIVQDVDSDCDVVVTGAYKYASSIYTDIYTFYLDTRYPFTDNSKPGVRLFRNLITLTLNHRVGEFSQRFKTFITSPVPRPMPVPTPILVSHQSLTKVTSHFHSAAIYLVLSGERGTYITLSISYIYNFDKFSISASLFPSPPTEIYILVSQEPNSSVKKIPIKLDQDRQGYHHAFSTSNWYSNDQLSLYVPQYPKALSKKGGRITLNTMFSNEVKPLHVEYDNHIVEFHEFESSPIVYNQTTHVFVNFTIPIGETITVKVDYSHSVFSHIQNCIYTTSYESIPITYESNTIFVLTVDNYLSVETQGIGVICYFQNLRYEQSPMFNRFEDEYIISPLEQEYSDQSYLKARNDVTLTFFSSQNLLIYRNTFPLSRPILASHITIKHYIHTLKPISNVDLFLQKYITAVKKVDVDFGLTNILKTEVNREVTGYSITIQLSTSISSPKSPTQNGSPSLSPVTLFSAHPFIVTEVSHINQIQYFRAPIISYSYIQCQYRCGVGCLLCKGKDICVVNEDCQSQECIEGICKPDVTNGGNNHILLIVGLVILLVSIGIGIIVVLLYRRHKDKKKYMTSLNDIFLNSAADSDIQYF